MTSHIPKVFSALQNAHLCTSLCAFTRMDLLGRIPSVVAFLPISFPLSTFLLFRIHPGLIEIFLFPQVSLMKSAHWSVKRSPQESTNPPIHPIDRDGFASSKREGTNLHLVHSLEPLHRVTIQHS